MNRMGLRRGESHGHFFKARHYHVPVPEWVKRADLVDDFRDVAARDGEIAAAAWCRRLKQQAESKAHD